MEVKTKERCWDDDSIEVVVKYKKNNSKYINDITLVNSYLDNENIRYEKSANKLWTILFNMSMLIKNDKLANKVLDKMLIKAENLHQ